MLIGDFFKFKQIENIEIRIGRRLGKDELCVLPDGCVEQLVVAERYDGALDAEPLEIGAAELERLLVGVVRDDDIWSPVLTSDSMVVVIALMPDENTTQSSAPSRLARRRSAIVAVGLP